MTRHLSLALAGTAALALAGCGQQHANTAHANPSALAKLKSEEPAKTAPAVSFVDAQGVTHTLAELHGRYVLLNLWATWCAPCVRELPALARLQAALGSSRLAVVPVSVGRDSPVEVAGFLRQHRAELPVYIDTKSAFLHAFGAFGLPLTVLIDPKGREIARASGAVPWDAKESISYFESLKTSETR